MNDLLAEILCLQQVEYAITEANGQINNVSPNFAQWLPQAPEAIIGCLLSDLFDELIGLEPEFEEIARGKRPLLKIEKIQRTIQNGQIVYLTFTVAPFAGGLLFLMADVTAESKLEQRVTQQRNELDLLATQLETARSQLDDLLHRFLPSAVADQIIANPNEVRLGGERRVVTILFADLRGFTRWTEHVEPEIALNMLNGKLGVAAEAIMANHGIVDKYMGDAVMGIFNVPQPDAGHAIHAVQAGWQLIEALRGDTDLQFSVGIHTGTAVAGNIGTAQMMNYTVIGDAVNQAKRLQEMAGRGQILISEEMGALLPESVKLNKVGRVILKGRSQETQLFEVTAVG